MFKNKTKTLFSNIIYNQKGNITKLINKNSENYNKFGEIYTTRIKPNKVKAWKMHLKMNSNLFVISGSVKFVLINKDRKNEIVFDEYKITEKKINNIFIPHNTIFGFSCFGKKESIIINFSDVIHTKDESINYKQTYFRYDWK